MSRFFSSAIRRLVTYSGYDKKLLPKEFDTALDIYSENGAVKKVGAIKNIEILHRNDGSSPVHQSSFNRQDKAFVISVRITPASGAKAKTHHVYADGTGTIKKGDKKEYSTLARLNSDD